MAKTSDYYHGKLTTKVYDRDQKCVICSSKGDLLVDHITPVKLGGRSNLTNLRILCRSCHSKRHNIKPFFQLSKIGKYLREWRTRNPDYITSYHRKWRKKNKGYYNKKYDGKLRQLYAQN